MKISISKLTRISGRAGTGACPYTRFKFTIIVMVALLLGVLANTAYGNYFVQKTVKGDHIFDRNCKTIAVKTAKNWHDYKLIQLPRAFINWNFNSRIKLLQNMQQGIYPKITADPAHFGIVATYGAKRNDDQIMVNNAIKGIGFLPKKDKLRSFIKLLKNTIHSKTSKKLALLKNLYKNRGNFDFTKLVSLELYTTTHHQTKTFLNQMHRPFAAIVFLAIPTYQIKTIVYLLSPSNPHLTPQEKAVATYVNLLHRYFHGGNKAYPVAIYNVVEVYNSTPDDPIHGEGKKT